jgi:myb proto-oncogene protein
MSSIKQALLLQQNGEEVLRKGPWIPEEDKILVEYVWQFGAWDWSSIPCKGLLPQTGKSCRL